MGLSGKILSGFLSVFTHFDEGPHNFRRFFLLKFLTLSAVAWVIVGPFWGDVGVVLASF